MNNDIQTSNTIADTLIERPHGFKVGGQRFYFYPVSLGKSIVIADIIKALNFNDDVMRYDAALEYARLCEEQEDVVLRLIVIHTMKSKKDIFNEDLVERRIEYFKENLSVIEKAMLLGIVLDVDHTDEYEKFLGIADDNKWKRKAIRAKNESDTSLSFGGVSIYGALIDFCCERYGWTMDYVLWGISYTNLKMLMHDAPTNIFLSKEEKKGLRIPQDRTKRSADDASMIEMIKQMNWD